MGVRGRVLVVLAAVVVTITAITAWTLRDLLDDHRVTLGLQFLVVMLLIQAVVLAWVIDRIVLSPIVRLRRQLQAATASADHLPSIEVHGPREIREAARDAEALRRGLVDEIIEVRAAHEAVLQQAPLVAAWDAAMRGSAMQVTGLDVAGRTRAAEGLVEGDWWDAHHRPDGSIGLVIADATGHGAQTGIGALQSRTVLRAAVAAGLSPSASLAVTARALDHATTLTALVIVIDVAVGRLRFANAGHPAALLVAPDGGVHELGRTGLPIGPLATTWSEADREFPASSGLVLFTDGVLEARRADGSDVGTDGVADAVRRLWHRGPPTAEHVVRAILEIDQAVSGAQLRDDTTVVVAVRPSR